MTHRYWSTERQEWIYEDVPHGSLEKRLRAWWNTAPHDMAESDFDALLAAAGVDLPDGGQP